MFKPSPQRHQHALTNIDMLKIYACCILLFTREINKVVHAYLVNVYSKFGGLHKMFSDNGTKFKNKLVCPSFFHLGNETGIQLPLLSLMQLVY